MDDINFGKLGKSKIIHIVKNDAICKKTKNKYINISHNNWTHSSSVVAKWGCSL